MFSRIMFLTMLLSAICTGAQAHEARFAAIWLKQPGPALVERHVLTTRQYRQQLNLLAAQGYCLVDLSGYTVGGQARFAAIWERKTCPAQAGRVGLTAQGLQQQLDQLVPRGFGPKLVDGYTIDDEARFAVIFEKSSGPAFVERHGLTSRSYRIEEDRLKASGYCLAVVSGYSVAGQPRFVAVWERRTCQPYVERIGLTSVGYQELLARRVAQGYRLKQVNGYRVRGEARFTAILDRSTGPALATAHGLTPEAYEQKFERLRAQGFRLTQLSGY